VRTGLGLASLAEGFIAYRSMGEQFSFFAEASRLVGKEFFKGDSLEMSSLHDAAPFLRGRGRRERAMAYALWLSGTYIRISG
jgi:hypothetical protein